ncbi:MAG: LmbE family protein [Acidobacteria bacterium]|nr:MAG: LmbE family protein [Acidobacteriota bacterium]
MSTFHARFPHLYILLLMPVVAYLGFLVPAYGQRNLSGAPEIELALHKLNVLGSVLMIAAHPDDENTALLAYYARGRSMRTGYLSITRGEGGQNLIGSEQGDLLGVIRTQELLAARHIDGAEQFFTRAIDFGYSKSADETLAKWGREKVLSDVVWVIRNFRPDVVILRFSGTPRDGHGQHQASAMLGKEAFSAAADKDRFREQLRYVQPWQAKRLLFNVFSFSAEQEKQASEMPHRVEVDTGEFNPVLGKSYTEIAGISRSQHRSQGMGAPERRGPSHNYLVTIAGPPADHDAFDDVATTWMRVSGGEAVGRILAEAERTFVPEQPEKTIPLLLKVRPLIAAMDDPLAKRKLDELDETLALCGGLWLDATADRYAAVPGSTVNIELEAINRSQIPVAWAGYSLISAGADVAGLKVESLAANQPKRVAAAWSVPADQPYSQPYWLRKAHTGETYEIEDQRSIGMADTPPVLTAEFGIKFHDVGITLRRPVHYRYVDPTEGERIRSLVVVPSVAVNLPEPVELFPSEKPKKIEVAVKANLAGAAGELHLDLPPGWRAEPVSQLFRVPDAGGELALAFSITPPHAEAQGRLRAMARVDGKEISSGMTVIAFPHIPPQTIFPDATTKLERANVALTGRKIGYVMGAGDQVPEALGQLGCEVKLLSARELAESDLGGFDVIVTGVRAYNIRADLRANQRRLLDYVRNGGTLIVQYNVAEGGPFGGRHSGELAHIGPYPLEVGRGRVSVEEAPVRFLAPDSPLLVSPNHISERDFEGWIQERGLYFASEWDEHYQPVLETHDPGEKPLEGGMLYTRYGKGVYIFSAFSWFRELPAGVPGAYRIFANMLSARGDR